MIRAHFTFRLYLAPGKNSWSTIKIPSLHWWVRSFNGKIVILYWTHAQTSRTSAYVYSLASNMEIGVMHINGKRVARGCMRIIKYAFKRACTSICIFHCKGRAFKFCHLHIKSRWTGASISQERQFFSRMRADRLIYENKNCRTFFIAGVVAARADKRGTSHWYV
jgi:hypothetical protein